MCTYSCYFLQITINRILKAQLAMRGLMIEWVNVRGFTEENPDDSKVQYIETFLCN